jgi:hypothetical protein
MSRALLGKLTVARRVKIFFEYYGTRKFITMFAKTSICSYLEPDKTHSTHGVHKTKEP